MQPYKCLCGNEEWEVRATYVDEDDDARMCLTFFCRKCTRILALFQPIWATEFQHVMEEFQREEDEKPPSERKWHPTV